MSYGFQSIRFSLLFNFFLNVLFFFDAIVNGIVLLVRFFKFSLSST